MKKTPMLVTIPTKVIPSKEVKKVIKAVLWITLALSIALILDKMGVIKATPETASVINIITFALKQSLSVAISRSGLLSTRE